MRKPQAPETTPTADPPPPVPLEYLLQAIAGHAEANATARLQRAEAAVAWITITAPGYSQTISVELTDPQGRPYPPAEVRRMLTAALAPEFLPQPTEPPIEPPIEPPADPPSPP